MFRKLLFFLFALLSLGLSAQTFSYPAAEFTRARQILMFTPGDELFDGVIHPAAALYENYFDVDEAAKEHLNYIEMLRNNGIEVLRVQDVLQDMSIRDLRTLADPAFVYDAENVTSISQDSVSWYHYDILTAMSRSDLIRCILRRPKVVLSETSQNTGMQAYYIHEPLMNMYFLRDQSITTPKGHIMCRMNSTQRAPEVDIIEACYKHLEQDAVYRIKGDDSYLEGGDYIPMGTFAFMGQGLRTTPAAISEILVNDVLGLDTLVVVHDNWKDQYQMHLDTYFNVIDHDLATLCFNRYDATDSSDPNFLTITMYARQPGTTDYHSVSAYNNMGFKDFLASRGINVIRISKEDADHYANNFLAIDARHIMSVANQSDELAATYAKYGVQVEWVPLENLICGYGAAHCMTQVLQRDAYVAPVPEGVGSLQSTTVPSTAPAYTTAGLPATSNYRGVVITDDGKQLQ